MNDLEELIDRMERIEWRDVPEVSALEASTIQQRFIKARDSLAGGDPHA